jgi:CubicO group peptidase (beta-lactamase class C family)
MLPASLLLLSAALSAAPPATVDAPQLGRIPTRLREFIEKKEIAGAVYLVAHRGKVLSTGALGLQNIEDRVPMRADSIFQIMSMTKPVTGVAIMMLAEEGRLSILDAVEKHLPEFADQRVGLTTGTEKPTKPITIHNLMTHTSGMPAPRGELSGLYQSLDRTLAEAVGHFARENLEIQPGSQWRYSNTGIATLGRIVEVVSGEPYEEFVRKRIFEPLGMKDSFYFPPDEKRNRVALLYERKAGKLVRAAGTVLGGESHKFRSGAKYPAPEFGMYSTAQDLYAFHQMMSNGGSYNGRRLLSPASVRAMTLSNTGDLRAGHWEGTGFGLTWEVVRDPIGTSFLWREGTFFHGGAFGTLGWVDPESQITGILMVQRLGGARDVQRAFVQMVGAAVH